MSPRVSASDGEKRRAESRAGSADRERAGGLWRALFYLGDQGHQIERRHGQSLLLDVTSFLSQVLVFP